ncbi:tolloid-like protein 1 [Lingula anatina]|uniref:Tolloid-like protein 1 n=1 Tax=Lingula anatina TaxID=7574 RepID=A0A2R2ML57_LINAN|nr:tolloid-like protein 1 [Lingula anatina]|eukprot:XP_023930951.1 tolloid-like protein 1 [Lingula anatina]
MYKPNFYHFLATPYRCIAADFNHQTTVCAFYVANASCADIYQSDCCTHYRKVPCSTSDACNATYISSSGTLTSPGHPSNYPSDIFCTYRVLPAPGIYLMSLKFTQFRTSCNDYVTLNTLTGWRLFRLCGDYSFYDIHALGYEVIFETDSIRSSSGFSALFNSFNADCDEVVPEGALQVASPNYPSNYPVSVNCLSVIKPLTNGSSIRLRFSAFDIELGSGCRYDMLKWFDYTYDKYIIGLCGLRIGLTMLSNTGIRLLLISDNTVTKRGFHATIEANNG